MIELTSVCKTFGKMTALSEINLKIDEPMVVGLVGNNGVGKTTLINILMGYYRPTQGSVKVMGEDPFVSSLSASSMFLVDEKTVYDPFLKLGQIIAKLARFDKTFDAELALSTLDLFNLRCNRIYSRLSKGMRNQFNIAVGIGANRPITVYDEPVAGLDETSRDKFYAMINDDFIKRPKLIIISSHLLAELQTITNKIIIMRDSKIIVYDDRDNLSQLFINLTGNVDLIRPLIANRAVYKEECILNIASVTIDDSLTRDEHKYIQESNITISGAQVNTVCKIICNSDWEAKK